MPRRDLAPDARLRHELVALLRGGNAHVPTLAALAGVPDDAIHKRPDGFTHSLWELLYHLWFAQRDILDFCLRPRDADPEWPASYWPTPDTPVDWEGTLAALEEDLEAMIGLAETGDLYTEFGHAPGYTLIREVLLAADHNAHHLGQVIGLRRALGLWLPPSLG